MARPPDLPASDGTTSLETASTFVEWATSASLFQMERFIAANSSLGDRLPVLFLCGLTIAKKTTSLRLILLCWHATHEQQCPRSIQLEAALGLEDGNDVFVQAGTGSGKTLTAVLNQLLETSDGLTMIISPLKRLQASHVRYTFRGCHSDQLTLIFCPVCQASDMERLYGLTTIVVNDDTPRDNTYWKVMTYSSMNELDFRLTLHIEEQHP